MSTSSSVCPGCRQRDTLIKQLQARLAELEAENGRLRRDLESTSREQSRQALSVAIHVIVQIASVGIEQRKLLLRGFDDARMTVPDQGHVVVVILRDLHEFDVIDRDVGARTQPAQRRKENCPNRCPRFHDS